jgi:ubiquinone/menaquinone biosynthesis C-methylase UbiE
MSTDAPTNIVNTEQAAAWNGPEGTHWRDAHRTGRVDDALVFPLVDAAAIAAGERVLDIGCGTGEMTLLAAWQAGAAGHARGVDLSSPMVDEARAAAAAQGIVNAEFEVGDAQVHPFTPASFDVAVSHFGIMFFGDPAAAFANVARALRPGGRLAFVTPQAMERCEWYLAPVAALLGHRPTADEAPSQMFSLAEPAVVERTLTDAGFADVRLTALPAALRFGPDVETATGFFVGAGPVRAVLERRDDLDEDRARELLTRALEPFLGDDGVRIPGAHWLVTARVSGR